MTDDNKDTELANSEETAEKTGPEPEILPPEVEFLRDAPPEVRKIFMSMQRMSGPMPHPLAEKLNENHIDKILDLAEKDDERAFKDTSQSRRYTMAYIAVFAGLFIFTTIFLVGKDISLYKELIKLVAVFGGGLGSGFGIKSYIDRNKR